MLEQVFLAIYDPSTMPRLQITITKRTDGGYVIACTRADGSVTWQKSASAAFFPVHDLTHFAVETELGHRRGFYGLVAEGWNFNDFGWLPDSRTLWWLSEEKGWSHLYASDGGKPRALTSGHWEASQPQVSADGRALFFLCNRQRPGVYEVCAVGTAGGEVREVTSLGLKEAKDLVEAGGKTVKDGINKDEAAKIKKQLEDQGATVEVK